MRSSSSCLVVILALAWRWHVIDVCLILVCFVKLAVILCSFVFAVVHVTVLGLLWDNFQCPLCQWFSIAIYASAFAMMCLQF